MKGGGAKKQRLGQEVAAAAAASSTSSSHDHWKRHSQKKQESETITLSSSDDDHEHKNKKHSKTEKFYKMKNEADSEEAKDGKGEKPRCVVLAHGPDCEGLMPSCVLRVVKDLDAWRRHVIKKMQAREAAQVEDTQGQDDDTQVENTQGNDDETQALDF